MLRSLAGASAFDRDELNSLLLEKRTALGEAQKDYDNLRMSDEDSWLNETQAEYKRLSGWAEQYPNAGLEAKRMILHHLIERVTLKRGYQVEIKLTISVQQFFGAEGEYLTTGRLAWGCQNDQVVRATKVTEEKVTVTSPSLQLKVANV